MLLSIPIDVQYHLAPKMHCGWHGEVDHGDHSGAFDVGDRHRSPHSELPILGNLDPKGVHHMGVVDTRIIKLRIIL